MPERKAGGEGEQRGEYGGRDWGPPRPDLDAKTAALAVLAFVAAFAVAVSLVGLSLTPDRLLPVLLAPALVLRRARRFLLDFVPFALLIVVYSEARGVAHIAHPHPFYAPMIDAERLLPGHRLPTVALQDWLWNGHLRLHDRLFVDVTRIHSLVPPTLAFVLWVKRRALFYRFAATILSLSFASALVFLLFPAAPPWAASDRGLIDHVTLLTSLHSPASGSASHLGNASVYHVIASNPYAAVPSLHGGYSFLVFLFVATLTWRTRWWWLGALAAVYPVVQGFSAVYTGNHYVVDLLVGYVFAAAALYGVWWVWRRRGLPE